MTGEVDPGESTQPLLDPLRNVVPAATGWEVGVLPSTDALDYNLVVIKIAHATGMTAVIVSPDDAARIAGDIREGAKKARHKRLFVPPVSSLILPPSSNGDGH